MEQNIASNVTKDDKRENVNSLKLFLLLKDIAANVSPETRMTPATPAPTNPESKLL